MKRIAVWVVLLALTLPLWRAHVGDTSEEDSGKLLGIRGALRLRGAPELLGAFFCYCSAESVCMLWAASYLVAVRGVGVKVASCVLLYGYHRLDVWPVDVWISRVVQEDFGGRSPFEGYGKYAGVYQQYLFLERLDREKRTLRHLML